MTARDAVLILSVATLMAAAVSAGRPVLPAQLEADLVITTSMTPDSFKGHVWSDLGQQKQRTDIEIMFMKQTEIDDFAGGMTSIISNGQCSRVPVPPSAEPMAIPEGFNMTRTEMVNGVPCDVYQGTQVLPMEIWVTRTSPALITKIEVSMEELNVRSTLNFVNHKLGPVDPSVFALPPNCVLSSAKRSLRSL